MQTMASILLVEDDADLREMLLDGLEEQAYHVHAVARLQDAKEALQLMDFDALLLDLGLPDGRGEELLRVLKDKEEPMAKLVMTASQLMDDVIESMRLGADDFVRKPFAMAELFQRLEACFDKTQVLKKYERIVQKEDQTVFDHMVGESPIMKRKQSMIKALATSNSTVLITGETGTGKEVVASLLHQTGLRSEQAFVSINCAAIPEALLESELFGHIKGAFTGAVKNRVGRFAMAHKGTIFLDEIGDLSLALQVKLLRVLQERSFEPVGSSETVQVDVRVIAATHQDLEALVAQGAFRQDLFYRLNVIPFELPPLRERQDDVLYLARHFIDMFNEQHGRSVTGLSLEAQQLMLKYAWPGNIRELQNIIERMLTFHTSGVLGVEDLPQSMLDGFSRIRQNFHVSFEAQEESINLKEMVQEYENSLLAYALKKSHNNRSEAARLLGMKRTTLIEKLKKRPQLLALS